MLIITYCIWQPHQYCGHRSCWWQYYTDRRVCEGSQKSSSSRCPRGL